MRGLSLFAYPKTSARFSPVLSYSLSSHLLLPATPDSFPNYLRLPLRPLLFPKLPTPPYPPLTLSQTTFASISTPYYSFATNSAPHSRCGVYGNWSNAANLAMTCVSRSARMSSASVSGLQLM